MQTRSLPVKNKQTIINFEYDFEQIYAFYCSRYKDITINDFLNLGIMETQIKLNSIPEDEPLYTIIKSRIVNLGTIKDKEERKYWRQLKKINAIPQEYLSTEEIYNNLRSQIKGGNYGKGLNKIL